MHHYSIIFVIAFLTDIIYGQNYLPKFIIVPPPLVYYSENSENQQKILNCKVWPDPPLSEVKYYSTERLPENEPDKLGHSQSQFLKSAPLHPLDSQYIENGNIVIKNINQVRRLSKLDLHCLAKTDFGAVISRPFRILEAKIGNFPTSQNVNIGEVQRVVKSFMHGNVAYVICDPPESYPPAKIEFRLNGTTIHMSPRYRYIKRPNSRQVTLLIQSFEPRDQGYYRCTAANTVTGEEKTDSLVQQLAITIPIQRVSTVLKLSLSGKESGTQQSSTDEIVVREGFNVTLFCIMEGAPPPHVTTFKLKSSASSMERHVSDKDFGLLTINNVLSEDEDTYQCSETLTSDSTILRVKKRLKISQGPQDIPLNALGTEARFTCSSSDPSITPQWYFNGRIKTQTQQAGSDSSILIQNVGKDDLGVYQCVARSQEEWVTEVATLSLKNSPVRSHGNDKDKRLRRKKNELLMPPDVDLIGDNVALYVRWQKVVKNVNGKYYRLQYRYKSAKQVKDWSAVETLDNQIKDSYFYITNRYLKAQHSYQFRFNVNLLSNDIQTSRWSREVSFDHVYPVRPTIQQCKEYNSTHIYIAWVYSDNSTYPINSFQINVRPSIQKHSKMRYLGYSSIVIRNPHPSEVYFGPLAGDRQYQVIVYAIYDGPPRKITEFSAEVTVTISKSDSTITSPVYKHNSDSSTHLMFIILGSLAGLMVLVIVVLVLMCYCRERKSVGRLNRYKDPAKAIHSDPCKTAHSSFLLATINAAANNHTQSICKQQIPDGSTERASLLGSGGPDPVYCQQKRQPPSGGSGHDISDGEAVSVQEQQTLETTNSLSHHSPHPTGMLTPQPPAVTYYKNPGPASLPAGSLVRQTPQMMQQQFYCGGPPVPCGPVFYANNTIMYPQGNYINSMVASPHQMMNAHISQLQGIHQMRQDSQDLRSQDGGESVYSSFSQVSNSAGQRSIVPGTVDTGSQTMNSNGTGSGTHSRHHRRKRRKTNHSVTNDYNDPNSPQPTKMAPKMAYPIHPQAMMSREVMYDTPPSGHDQRMMGVPPGMILVQPNIPTHPDPNWATLNNTLTRRGTPTLFVEPPRIRDYSEYGIPQNQMIPHHPHQLAHLSQQNLHLHNQNLSGYRDAQA